ncbi:MAG TPA: fused MFS/spermidine synthase, partial [Planctomycetota bacterium]|nr:fused MFS/spermidine synthase [Planctomycetota bacterium]
TAYVVEERESAYHTVAVVGFFSPGRVLAGLDAKSEEFQRRQELMTRKPSEAARLDPEAVLEMRFSNLTESSLFLNKPGQPPATTYTRVLNMGMAFNPQARRVLVVGLGGGSVPRQFCEIYGKDMRVDVVEIDPVVLDVAREHFGFRDGRDKSGADPYCAYVEDARQFIRNGGGRFEKYDLIILDAYSGGGQIPAHLVTREFLSQVRDRLADGGVLVSNIISPLEGRRSRFFRAEYRTICELFPNVYVFPVIWDGERGGYISTSRNRNLIMVVPRDGDRRLNGSDILVRTADLMEKHPGLKDLRLDAFAADYMATGKPEENPDIPVLTDAFAPVETMFWYERGK